MKNETLNNHCTATDGKPPVDSSAYYGTLSINDNLLTIVKVVNGGVMERRMVKISFWKSFMEKEDWKNAVHHIEHSTMSYYHKEQLGDGCDEAMFNRLYNIALRQF